jgi:2Fe-2S ferredoxin
MGKNPYIDDAPPPPKQRYRIKLRNTGQTIEVDPEHLPQGYDGQEGSVLGTLLHAGVDIDHSCGGVVACSTCHIWVHAGGETAPAAIEEEEDMLDYAPGLRATSRLACQCVPDGSKDIEVEIPPWNRNAVKEGH